MGFVIPYRVLSFAIWLQYVNGRPENEAVMDKAKLRVGIAFISLACLIAFVVCLESVMEFLGSLPSFLRMLPAGTSFRGSNGRSDEEEASTD